MAQLPPPLILPNQLQGPPVNPPPPSPNPSAAAVAAGAPTVVEQGNPLQRLLERVQTDPTLQRALMVAGAQLLAGKRDSFAGNLGEASLAGIKTLEGLRAQQREEARKQRELELEKRKVLGQEQRDIASMTAEERRHEERMAALRSSEQAAERRHQAEMARLARTIELAKDSRKARETETQYFARMRAQQLFEDSPEKYKSVEDAMPDAWRELTAFGIKLSHIQRQRLELMNNITLTDEERNRQLKVLDKMEQDLLASTGGRRQEGPSGGTESPQLNPNLGAATGTDTGTNGPPTGATGVSGANSTTPADAAAGLAENPAKPVSILLQGRKWVPIGIDAQTGDVIYLDTLSGKKALRSVLMQQGATQIGN